MKAKRSKAKENASRSEQTTGKINKTEQYGLDIPYGYFPILSCWPLFPAYADKAVHAYII